jgi:hypothetical protein
VVNVHRLSKPGLSSLLQIRSSAWLEHYTDNVGVTSSNLVGSTTGQLLFFHYLLWLTFLIGCTNTYGGLAQLARASALHAEGHRFDSDILHTNEVSGNMEC